MREQRVKDLAHLVLQFVLAQTALYGASHHRLKSRLGTHVVTIDVETHRAYFPLKNFGGQAMLRILQPRL